MSANPALQHPKSALITNNQWTGWLINQLAATAWPLDSSHGYPAIAHA